MLELKITKKEPAPELQEFKPAKIEVQEPVRPLISNIFEDTPFLAVVDAVPTTIPKRPFEKMKIYVNGGTLRLYVFDETNKLWRFSTLI